MTQKEITDRKEQANGLKVIRAGEDLYLVEASDGRKCYKVTINGGAPECTCPDFPKHSDEEEWQCKHIISAERAVAHGTVATPETEPALNRRLLEKPFEPQQIKQRKGNFGDMLDYIEGHAVIKRLNEAFGGDWSFEVASHQVFDEEVLVVGKLKAAGIIKMQFGSSKVTRNSHDGSLVSLGDDLKAAATDALKKAATLLGVGLHLYGQKRPAGRPQEEQSRPSEPGITSGPDASGRLTNRQLSAIYAIAQSKGMNNKEVEANTIEVFNKKPEYLSKEEASVIIQQLQDE